MKYEFHAHFPFALQDALTQSAAIDFLAGKRTHPPHAWPELPQVEDAGARMTLLAQALVTDYKDQSRVGARNDPGGYIFWLKHQAETFLAQQRRWLDMLNLNQSGHSLPNLTLLPIGSFALHFTFTLTSPYLSKDDTALHLLDSPVKKEWVFKLPYVASTQWKGSLRHALWQLGHQKEDDQIKRLFGAANEADLEKGNSGRLYFYPTFFDQLSLEVINPHDRQTGAGSLPIYFEAVPGGASGSFTLLYIPLDRIGQSETETRQQIFTDLQRVAQGLEAMFTRYGFGAKTSSGFGLAELAGEGRFEIRYPDAQQQPPRPQEPLYPEGVREFLESYPAEYLDMKPKQLKDAGVPNRMRQQAKEIKALYLQYQDDLALYQNALATWETAAATPAPLTTARSFAAFSDLADILPSPIGDA